jgi:3-oxoadipate enol-lactonase
MPFALTDDGVELHYLLEDYRDPWLRDPAEVILLHHGFARSLKWWTQWVPTLSRRYRVLRYDCRGCGLSSIPREPASWTAERFAVDALNLIDQIGIDRVHWVGFESGGVFGMLFAAMYPDRVSSLTLVTTPSEHWMDGTYAAPQPTGRMHATMRRGHRSVSEAIEQLGFRRWLELTMADRMDVQIASEELLEWHLNEHSKTSTHVAAAIMRVVEATDVRGLPARISAPTLMMTGEKSIVAPPDDQRAIVDRMTAAPRLVIFPGIGSGIQLLIPDRCTEELVKFLESLPPS